MTNSPRRSQGSLGPILFSFVVTLSCTVCAVNKDGQLKPTWVVDTTASGAVRVTNSPVDRAGPLFRVGVDLKLGAVDGGPEEFDNVRQLAIDSAGRLYVLMARAGELRVFTRDGRFVRSIGHRGQGPGELMYPAIMGFATNNVLWISDAQNRRYSVYDSTGAFLHNIPRHRVGRSPCVDCGWLSRSGTFFDGERRMIAPSVMQVRVFRLNQALEPVDSLALPLADSTPSTVLRPFVPFSRRLVYTFDPYREVVVFALSDAYTVFETNMNGDTTRIIELDVAPEPLQDAELDSARAAYAVFAARIGATAEMERRNLPAVRPIIAAIVRDEIGRTWIARTDDKHNSTQRLDVFDLLGRYMGYAQTSFPIALPSVAGPEMNSPPPFIVLKDEIVALTRDEFGVEYVVRGRLRP